MGRRCPFTAALRARKARGAARSASRRVLPGWTPLRPGGRAPATRPAAPAPAPRDSPNRGPRHPATPCRYPRAAARADGRSRSCACALDSVAPRRESRRSSSPSGRPRNASRRFVDSATNRRETALLDVARSVTSTGTGSNVPAYRRVDTPAATAASVCSFSGSVAAAHWKLTSGTSPSALRTRSRGTSTCRPPSVTGLSTLPPRHAGRSTWWRPFGPHSTARSASIIASRTCSPVAMHKPWNASRTPCTTPSTGNGT